MDALEGSLLVQTAQVQSPSSARLLLAAASYAGIGGLSALVSSISLPFDEHFRAVVYLMCSGNPESRRYLSLPAHLTLGVCVAGFLVVLVGAIVPRDLLSEKLARVMRRFYRYSLALPVFFFLSSNMGRYVANSVYSLAKSVRWDATALLGRLETPLIEWLQHALYSPLLSAICSFLYSVAWTIPLLIAGIAFFVLDKPQALNQAIVGYLLLPVLAIPFFVLLPVFDPWTTNPLYSNPGAWHSQILYLYSNPDLPKLIDVCRHLKWATGSCLPSLHIAFPLLLFFIVRKNHLQLLTWLFLFLSVLSTFTIVYLGRHWLLDAVLALPYSYIIMRLIEKMNLNFILD